MMYSGDDRSDSGDDRSDFMSATTKLISDITRAWSWVQPEQLPRIYPQIPVNTNQCQFSSRMRHRKTFQGHRFKLGGRKE